MRRPYSGATFGSVSLNIGPRTVCFPHRDIADLVYGICVDAAFGPFDHTRGGHLILHEARIVLEMRPGRMVIFPSAAITHENIPIGLEEERFGITAYIAAGFWRFLAQGQQTREIWMLNDLESVAMHDAAGSERWQEGCLWFKTMAELKACWQGNA